DGQLARVQARRLHSRRRHPGLRARLVVSHQRLRRIRDLERRHRRRDHRLLRRALIPTEPGSGFLVGKAESGLNDSGGTSLALVAARFHFGSVESDRLQARTQLARSVAHDSVAGLHPELSVSVPAPALDLTVIEKGTGERLTGGNLYGAGVRAEIDGRQLRPELTRHVAQMVGEARSRQLRLSEPALERVAPALHRAVGEPRA